MALPGVNITFVNGGLGGGTNTGKRFCVIGPGYGSATKNTLGTVGSSTQVATQIGAGPCGKVVDMFLSDNGGSCDYIVANASVAQVSSSISSGSGVPVLDYYPTTGSEIYEDLDAIVTVTKAGAEGVAEYKASFDSGKTYTPPRKIPSTLTDNFSDFNLTLKFSSDTYAVADAWLFSSTGSQMNTTDLANAQTALVQSNRRYTDIVYATNFTTSSQMTTFASAVDSDLTELKNAKNPAQIAHLYIGQGEFTAGDLEQAASEVASTLGNGLVLHAGKSNQSIVAPVPGYSAPKLPNLFAGSSKIAQAVDIATNPAQKTSAFAVTRMTDLDYDENKEGQVLSTDVNKVITYSTIPNSEAIYPTQAWVKNDNKYIMWQRISTTAFWVAYDALMTFVNTHISTLPVSGFVTPAQKVIIEDFVNGRLNAALLQATNSQGGSGFVNPPPGGKMFVLNPTYDVITNDALDGNLVVYPFANASNINVKLGLSS